ncbi:MULTISPECIES: sulfurtransferase [unclassified Acinetobacter]|uniref:sulfurtransferase n=1 Tax=unclassified Acinetobacter TaxID=196816 RepID=UPI0035BAB683
MTQASSEIPLLLEAEQLWQLLQTEQPIKLLDVSRANVYRQVHIPQAIAVSPQDLLRSDEMATGLLPKDVDLQALINKIGVYPEHHVVIYDDEGGAWAGRVLWNLHCAGFYQVSVLNGGLHAWLASNLPVSNQVPEQNIDIEKCFQINTSQQAKHRIELSELQQLILQDGDKIQLWDCRSQEEYRGERRMSRRAGHIPNAICYPHSTAICYENHLKLQPLSLIQQQLQQLGFDLNKPVVVYCQSHHRSGLAYLLALLLGWSVRAYDGAWSEWGNHRETAVVCGA